MTIGKKITLGFAMVLALLVLAGLLSYTGVGGLVNNAKEVIDGNRLDCTLAEKEIAHLNWVGKVNALLTDEKITQLNVQTDPKKCSFGKWLFGEGRKQAEILIPSLAPLLSQVEKPHARLHTSAIAISRNFKAADDKLPGFLGEKEADHFKWVNKICRLFLNNGAELKVETDPHKCALGKWYYSETAKKAVAGNPELSELYAALEKPHRELHASAVAIQQNYRQIHPGLLESLLTLSSQHHEWAKKVCGAIAVGNADLGVQTDPAKCGLGRWLASAEGKAYMQAFPPLKKAMQALEQPHRELHLSAIKIQAALAQGDGVKAKGILENQVQPALAKVVGHLNEAVEAETALVSARNQALQIYEKQTLTHMDKARQLLEKMRHAAEGALQGQRKARQIYANQTMPALAEVRVLINKIRKEAKANIMTDQAMLTAASGTRFQVSLVSVIAIIVGMFLSVFLVRGITKVLRGISGQMSQGALQVASAAGQVSNASQGLAQGSSEQAASLEETSSSMEEMASVTRQNADNAGQADSMMKEAGDIVAKANQAMQKLRQAMEKINSASDETAKIIKTIDEIAFQTNLLALNAAVEAARAGEAGAGFAVVADEVRNLAMRAAEAAKNTASLIEENIKDIKTGSDLVVTTDEAFTQVQESASKVAGLVGEIAAASSEQATGIDQVNTAMSEMDRVTQQVAANAEESAAAAEELSAQAETMKAIVGELMRMTGGGNGKETKRLKGGRDEEPKALPEPRAHIITSGKATSNNAIPLGEDDFTGF
jgi:methyl-accepting chemotaxis protein